MSCGFSHIPEITFLRDHILKFETTLNNGVPIPSGIFAAIRPRHNAGYGLAIESSDISAPVGQLLRRKDAASSPQASKGARSAACTGQLVYVRADRLCKLSPTTGDAAIVSVDWCAETQKYVN